MLVLTRKTNEQILIGENVIIRVLRTSGRRVTLGIEAPETVCVRRDNPSPSALPVTSASDQSQSE